MRVDRYMLGQQLHDRRHSEHVRNPPPRDQSPSLVRVESVAGEQHRLHSTRHLHELMHACSMRKRRQDQGRISMRRGGHQIAKVICYDECHLAMGEDRRLGPPRRARREEEPAWIVMLDGRNFRALSAMLRDETIIVVAEFRRSDRNDEPNIGSSLARDRNMLSKVAMADHRGGAAHWPR